MSEDLDVKRVNSWNNLIIAVSRECGKAKRHWRNIGEILIQHQNNNYHIPVFQYNNKPLFGFEESDNKTLTKCPILTYEAIAELLRQLRDYLINTKNIYLLIHSEELGYDSAADCVLVFGGQQYRLNNRSTQKCHAMLEPDGQTPDEWSIYLKELANSTGNSGKHLELWEFIHDNRSPIYKCLKSEGNTYECLLTHGLKKNVIEPFSLLKHHIMTSFLDLDIDWQGINELSKKNLKVAQEYLDEVLKKSNNYYCQKLVNLWFYLKGNEQSEINNIIASLNEDQLPYKKSVLDLINELTNEAKEKRLQTLLEHVGLKINKKEPSIIDYLKNLDSMVKNENKRDINKFLSLNFHEWYLKLGDLLDELKSFSE